MSLDAPKAGKIYKKSAPKLGARWIFSMSITFIQLLRHMSDCPLLCQNIAFRQSNNCLLWVGQELAVFL